MYERKVIDEKWEEIKNILNPSTRGPKRTRLRLTVEAILYLNKTGLSWRKLPANFPNFSSVYFNYIKWKKIGSWEKVLKILNIKSEMSDSSKYTSKYNSCHEIFIKMFEKGYSQKYISNELQVPVASINKMVKKYYIKKYVRRQKK